MRSSSVRFVRGAARSSVIRLVRPLARRSELGRARALRAAARASRFAPRVRRVRAHPSCPSRSPPPCAARPPSRAYVLHGDASQRRRSPRTSPDAHRSARSGHTRRDGRQTAGSERAVTDGGPISSGSRCGLGSGSGKQARRGAWLGVDRAAFLTCALSTAVPSATRYAAATPSCRSTPVESLSRPTGTEPASS